MKIYTKTGDGGTTSLVGGTRVSKAHPRVEAYGNVDELISHLGVLRSECIDIQKFDIANDLRRIQVHLMNVSAHLAADKEVAKLKPLDLAETDFLESEIDRMTALLPPQNTFLLPGAPRISSEAHVARTICRRCERSAVAIENRSEEDLKGSRYINRLSDYLFVLARYLCVVSGGEEDKWIP